MWDFLFEPAGFDIGETGWLAFEAWQPLWRAMLVGLLNTLRVALPALLLATALALTMALLRYKRVPLWERMAAGYVNLVRNVPLLLQLLIWYFLLIEWLPESHEAVSLLPGWWLSKGGLSFPWWGLDEDTGLAVWQVPQQGTFNIEGGGAVTPEFLALMLALSIYTSAFLSEIIRSGLEAVPRALLEAADTLGATRWQQIRQVLLPQALRTIVPGATNQYLNVIKNSSLAVAIGYPDLVSVTNTALNQTGQAIACITVMMSIYLALSLITSALMNWFNARYALRGAV